MDAHRPMGLPVEFDGYLRLGIGPQIRHDWLSATGKGPVRVPQGEPGTGIARPKAIAGMPYLREHLQQPMRQRQGQRHILRRILASIAEHHALVSGALGHLILANHAAVDIRTLLVDRRNDAAGIRVEAVLGLSVADAGDGLARNLFNIDIGTRGNLAANNHKPGRAKRFAGDLGLRILAQELIKNGI